MNKTKRALAWMAKGGLRKDMAADLGLTDEECTVLIKNMSAYGYIERAYVLTERGQARADYVPKNSPRAQQYLRDYYYRNKEKTTGDQVVAAVKRSVPNSVFALGSM